MAAANAAYWSQSAARAESLAGQCAGSAVMLHFYAGLARLLATGPAWEAFIDWGSAQVNPEIAAAAREATPGDQANLFARAWRWRASNPVASAAPAGVAQIHTNFCPACGGKPFCALLRPDSDTSRRSLVCGQCGNSWPYPRIRCANCDEQRFDELPVLLPDAFPHLRIECCATCKQYLLALDLGKEPDADPLADDIAALPVHVWASDHGYTKIEPNWFGF